MENSKNYINGPLIQFNKENQTNKKIEPIKDLHHLSILKLIYDSKLDKVVITNKNQLVLAKQFIKTHPYNAYSILEVKSFNTFHNTKKQQASFILLGGIFSFLACLYSLFRRNRFKVILYINSMAWWLSFIYYVKVARFGIYENFINKELKEYMFTKYYNEVYLNTNS